MPFHPITFLWVEQQDHERGMTYQAVELAARQYARYAKVDAEPLPEAPPGRVRTLADRIRHLPSTIVHRGSRRPSRASSQTGSTGA